jgi:hypothetical protein
MFNATARCLRKVGRSRRFDRVRASKPLYVRVDGYWQDGLDALWAYMAQGERWEKLQRHTRLAEKSVSKALSDADRKLLMDLLSSYTYFDDVETVAAAIVKATRFDTFEDAAKFALGQLGVKAADFELRNERIREFLESRKSAEVMATRHHLDQVFETIVNNFYELGRNPFDKEFLEQLRKDLGYTSTYEAKRFALTETGIASELAQVETYRRNGVVRKQWNILGDNTRPTHAVLDGVQVEIDEKFDVGGYAADHPLDPTLPAAELVNCHCWLSPVVDDDYQIDPSRIWEGE